MRRLSRPFSKVQLVRGHLPTVTDVYSQVPERDFNVLYPTCYLECTRVNAAGSAFIDVWSGREAQ